MDRETSKLNCGKFQFYPNLALMFPGPYSILHGNYTLTRPCTNNFKALVHKTSSVKYQVSSVECIVRTPVLPQSSLKTPTNYIFLESTHQYGSVKY